MCRKLGSEDLSGIKCTEKKNSRKITGLCGSNYHLLSKIWILIFTSLHHTADKT